MLQEFEIDSNCCNIVAQMLLELVRVTTLPLTLNPTLYQNAPHKNQNKSHVQFADVLVDSMGNVALKLACLTYYCCNNVALKVVSLS